MNKEKLVEQFRELKITGMVSPEIREALMLGKQMADLLESGVIVKGLPELPKGYTDVELRHPQVGDLIWENGLWKTLSYTTNYKCFVAIPTKPTGVEFLNTLKPGSMFEYGEMYHVTQGRSYKYVIPTLRHDHMAACHLVTLEWLSLDKCFPGGIDNLSADTLARAVIEAEK